MPLELDASRPKLLGKVLGLGGPLGGARVRAYRRAEDGLALGGGMVGKAVTNDDGHYELEGLFVTGHDLVVEKEGYLTAFEPWQPAAGLETQHHDMALQPAPADGVVRIRAVAAATGEAVAARVRLSRATGDRFLTFAYGETGGDGQPFAVPRLPGGRYVVHVPAPAASAYRDEQVTFDHEPGGEREVTVRMRPGGSTELSVTTKEGLVPPLSTVELLDEKGSRLERSGKPSSPLSAGRILLSGVPPGRWRARVTAPGYEPATVPIEVRAGEVSRMEVKLAPAPKSPGSP